jgi:hypothetical protein
MQYLSLLVDISYMLESFNMKWKGGKIANVDSFFDFWDKSDPYLKFLKIRPDNTFAEAARTEILKDNQDPNWKSICIPANRLIADVKNPNSSFKYSKSIS